MAASGTFNISTNNQYISGYVAWSESNVDIVNNTSSLTMSVYLHRTNNYSGDPTALNNINLTRTFYFGNQTSTSTQAVTMTIPNNKSYVLVAQETKNNIAHNSDGTLSISIGFAMSNARNVSGFTVPAQYSTATLSTIARTSTFNSASINLNTNKLTWSITRYSNSFKDNLVVYSGNYSFTINEVATSSNDYSLNSTQLSQIYSMIGNSTTANISLYVNTYSGSTLIGRSNVVTIAASLPSYSLQWDNASCVDNISTYDTYKNNNNDLITNLSNPKFTFSASSSTGSNYGKTITYRLNDSTVTSPTTITNYTGQSFVLKATDGRTVKDITWSPSNTIVNYSYPTIQCKLVRTSPTASTATVTLSGTYYDGNGLTNLESLALVFKYTESGGSEITITNFNITSQTSNHIISFTATANITGLDYTKGISYVASLTDLIGISPTSANGSIPRGKPAWNAYYDINGDSNFNVYGFYRRNEDCFFPIGYIYMSVDSTNPSTYFGGTWTQIMDTFLLAAGNSYSAGATGGAATVTLNENQLPSHRHSVSITTTENGSHSHTGNTLEMRSAKNTTYGDAQTKDLARPISSTYDHAGLTITNDAGGHTHSVSGNTGYTGSGQAHDNMPPYLTVYMWKRTA